jgi:hypothetical protein
MITPLSDLNIVQVAIPIAVQAAVKDPYQIPADTSCIALAERIHKLDAALGADLDVLALRAEKTNSEKGGEFLQNEAISGVRRTISGFIPFEGWIRKLTGADSHARDVEAAIAAGIVHRAFLKGLGVARGCEPPAAPMKHPLINAPVTVPISDPAAPGVIPKPAEPIPEGTPKASTASMASQ